jgi:hypothetical protein
MDQHLSVKEACKLTSKSESTIKRMIREIVADADQDDRQFIVPNHEELERRRAAKEPYVWKIDQQLLLRRFPQAASQKEGARSSPDSTSPESTDTNLTTALRDQIQSLENQNTLLVSQLDRKDGQISNLNERMRESNILMKELQQRLAIAAPAVEPTVPSTETPHEPITASEVIVKPKEGSRPKPTNKKSTPTKSSTKQKPQSKKKRTLFGILHY